MADRQIRASSGFEFEGFWWEPAGNGDGPKPAQGRLVYEPDSGAKLTVVDLHPNADFFDGPRRLPVIHGRTLGDEPVSLFDVLRTDFEGYGIDGHSSEEWSSNQLIYGAHVDDPEQFEVQRIRLKLRGLREWLGHVWHWEKRHHKGLGLDPGFVEVDLDGAKLTLSFSQRRIPEQFEERVEIWASALFEFDQPIALPTFKERYSGPLENFLLLATHEESQIESMTSLADDAIEKWWGPGDERTIPIEREIEIVERIRAQPLAPRKNPYRRLLLPWAVWGEDASDAIKRWFDLRADLAGPGDALFATLNVRYIYLENQLLNLTSFAEAYHRHREGGDETMADRLKALFGRAGEVVEEATSWQEHLAQLIANTRNYLTHWEEKGDRELLQGRDRWLAVMRLRIVIETNLALDLGLDPELASACFRAFYWDHPALTADP
jgi:hypothetical protein